VSEKTIVHQPGEGMAFWLLGGLYEVLVSSDQSNGAVTIMQMTMPEGSGPPPHTHPGTETVYVASGTIDYHIGGEILTGKAGSLFYIPKDTLEFFVPTSATASVVVTYAPGGIERFFAEVGEPALRREIPPASATAPDFEHIVRTASRYGMEILPPGAS